LRLLTERYVRQGMSEAEAARAARRQFGNATLLQEAHRDMRGIRFIETLFQDLRFGVRMLLKSKSFTAVAALSLALGMGADTAIFSLIDAVMLKRLQVKQPEQLTLLRHPVGGKTISQFPYRTYKQLREQNEVFEGLLAWHPLRLTVSVDNNTEPAVAGQLV